MRLMLALLAFAAALPAAEANLPPLETVAELDLERYKGRWYEVARIENRFQKKCAGEVTATYRLLENAKIEVVNECRSQDGGQIMAQGEARVADGPSRLEVRFAPKWLSFLPMVWGDYWVIDLADDYSWAAVGAPSRKYFWVLSREPKLAEQTLQGIIERAEAQGFELDEIVLTRQDSPVTATE